MDADGELVAAGQPTGYGRPLAFRHACLLRLRLSVLLEGPAAKRLKGVRGQVLAMDRLEVVGIDGAKAGRRSVVGHFTNCSDKGQVWWRLATQKSCTRSTCHITVRPKFSCLRV